MSVTQQYRATIQKLKKRIHALERQQEQGRKKLKRAMNEARKYAKSIKGKATVDHASSYARAALDMERKMLKAVEKKAQALAATVMEIDKKQIMQLVQSFIGKFSKNGNGKVKKAAGKKAAKKARKKRKSN